MPRAKKTEYRLTEDYLRHQGKKEIDEGLEQWRIGPTDRNGDVHRELEAAFEKEYAETPLQRSDLENLVMDFIKKNYRDILPLVIWGGDVRKRREYFDAMIRKVGMTNEDLAMFGAEYSLSLANNLMFVEQRYFADYHRYDNEDYDYDYNYNYRRNRNEHRTEVTDNKLLALVWAKLNVREDVRAETNELNRERPHRYFLRPAGRYLGKNDYGMGDWNDEEDRLVYGSVSTISNFITAVGLEFDRQMANFNKYLMFSFGREYYNVKEAQNIFMQQHGAFEVHDGWSFGTDQEVPGELLDRMSDQVAKPVYQNIQQKIADHFEKNSADLHLLLSGVTEEVFLAGIDSRFLDIAKRFNFLSDDPIADYQNFEKNAKKLEDVLLEPSAKSRAGTTIDFFISEFYDRPVIFAHSNKAEILRILSEKIKNILCLRAVRVDSDAALEFETYRSQKSTESGFWFADSDLYDFIKLVGKNNIHKILGNDYRENYRKINGWLLLKKLRFDIMQMDLDQFNKQLVEANKIMERGTWDYLEAREKQKIEAGRRWQGKKAEGKSWEEVLDLETARQLFFEAKKMNWLSAQVFFKNPYSTVRSGFYSQRVDWRKYDISTFEVSRADLDKYFSQNVQVISSLLSIDKYYNENGSNITPGDAQAEPPSLGLILKVLAKGHDLKGAAIARDKQRYLKGLAQGFTGDDLAYAIADWPTSLSTALSPEEISIYYEYAGEYLKKNPHGLLAYAQWRSSPDGQEWRDLLSQKVESKSDLDFRMCLAAQDPQVRSWYKTAADYLGNSAMQTYLLRFNSTVGYMDGTAANWHDVLFWVPNIKRIGQSEAKSILSSIRDADENSNFINLLPRYDKTHDKLSGKGPILSVRELNKRVMAIESNFDFEGLSQEIVDITSAPGFNLRELQRMRNERRFLDLVGGKFDEKQPFKPHRRSFAGRSLTEALKEGLGSYKNNIRGTAADVKGLFHELRQLVKNRKIGDRKMEVADLLQSVPVDLEEEVIRLLQKQLVDIGPLVEATVHAKSDPEGWVCGNYTDCCMPFGDYKNTDYMFNPSTQYFTIKYNGRIVAQSVVTDSRSTRNNADVVVLDNIEVANNYKELLPLLAQVYQTFWAEYTSLPVKVGTGYSDLVPPGGKLEPNIYQPKTHLAYSDAQGHQVYDLPKIRGIESMDKIVTFANITDRDAEQIVELEKTIYPEGMVQGRSSINELLERQRELEVPGAASSVIIRSGQEVAGYLLMLPGESQINDNEQVAEIHDMALLPKFQGQGLGKRMIERIMDLAIAYQMPIEAEARASTSYAMLMNEGVRRWLADRGFVLTHNQRMENYLGNENFYLIRFEYKGAPNPAQ